MLKIPPLAGFFLPEFSADDPRHKKAPDLPALLLKNL
ncbi:hypothetical protein M568_05175 [Salmonella enterica subsp. enterica serovar Namur str. 05-2929]|nr:hypothetical protein SEPB56_00485 [Salmonella enterica subsp. enterica serovar Paratyphi B str. SARA56]ESF42410.1 hypothetical protein SEES7308_19757 [Salmonella enterica subsp. enterica serovar Stanley str. ATCC 7308]ESF63632.1 hypothetical protein SEES0695_19821 [Salmonella enterica subsp. enterica serovar Soerenga str. 695]ESF89037.1 hypothetical protein SEEPB759_01848 [Salmonella enterica subsp. enterica serovar Paratyphi B str. ATCC 8759]EXX83232.1 hypothetical protein M568_05175 [Salmo